MTYRVNRVIILVDGDTIFVVYDCCEPGRFGFYNYSQQDVFYSDFTYELVVDFNFEQAEICAGDTAYITFLEQCGANNNLDQTDVLQWDFGDGTTEIKTTPKLSNVKHSHVYQTDGNYTVILIA